MHPLPKFLNAVYDYPNLQSMHKGAQRVQQQEYVDKQPNPHAYAACQLSIHCEYIKAW